MKKFSSFFILLFLTITVASAQEKSSHPKTPLMGWSSWNSFRIAIDENIIKAQADIMASTKLKDAGYNFINIDDGFFGGRNSKGELLTHTGKFPSGMKSLADHIHKKGLKAGIYAEAGINTCASMWDKDTIGIGSGLYGHDEQDLKLLFVAGNFQANGQSKSQIHGV